MPEILNHQFVVKAGTKVADFLVSNRAVDVIEGPLGSGKTKALCARMMRHAQEQKPSPIDGIRRTRWAMIRNTLPDLKRTTIRTWLETFPEHIYGRFVGGAVMEHRIRFADVMMNVDFLSLDHVEDVRKLRSGEYTGIAFNELQYIEKELFDEAGSRLRYPPKEHGGPTWRGVIADANAPDEDHWLAWMTGQVEPPPGLTDDEKAELIWPESWGLHIQPPALIEKRDDRGMVVGYEVNPDAENLSNLPSDYYEKQIVGKSKAWIDSRLMVRVVLVTDGSAVWPMFRAETHVSLVPLRPTFGHEVTVGLDFGRQPAAIFMQAVNNRIYVQHELLGLNEGAVTFAPKVKRFLETHYQGYKVRFFGDPKGQDKGQADERTAYDIFRSLGMPVAPAPNLKQNMIETRVDAVTKVLNEMHNGMSRFVLSPLCRTLRVAMAGRYHLVREEDGVLRPKKDRYSNPADALQYGILGLGEGRKMLGLDVPGMMRGLQAYKGRKTMRRIEA